LFSSPKEKPKGEKKTIFDAKAHCIETHRLKSLQSHSGLLALRGQRLRRAANKSRIILGAVIHQYLFLLGHPADIPRLVAAEFSQAWTFHPF